MITVSLSFSYEEARKFFESAGLTVKEMNVAAYPKSVKETLSPTHFAVWMVVNPHTNVAEDLKTAFVRCVHKNKNQLTADIDKVEIFNSFRKS